MVLWILLAVMTAGAALLVIVPINRARSARRPAESQALSVYADQLAEIERDADRGLIGREEAVAARSEISRRILKADQAATAAVPTSSSRAHLVASMIVALALPAIGVGLYGKIGAPDLGDQPLAQRKADAIDRKSPEALIGMLDQRLAQSPDDAKGWEIAGPIYMRLGRFDDAAVAFRNTLRLLGPSMERQLGLGQALTALSQGVVTPEAKVAFEAAQALQPEHHLPRMYLALALSQDGKLAESAAAWKAIIASGKGDEPWLPDARKELASVEAQLGRTGEPKPGQSTDTPPAPSMIESMVARLDERLSSQGGTAEDWGRLVRSLAVLGRKDQARQALERAHKALANDTAGLAGVDALARELGL